MELIPRINSSAAVAVAAAAVVVVVEYEARIILHY
jgi:hypothetical protein